MLLSFGRVDKDKDYVAIRVDTRNLRRSKRIQFSNTPKVSLFEINNLSFQNK